MREGKKKERKKRRKRRKGYKKVAPASFGQQCAINE